MLHREGRNNKYIDLNKLKYDLEVFANYYKNLRIYLFELLELNECGYLRS